MEASVGRTGVHEVAMCECRKHWNVADGEGDGVRGRVSSKKAKRGMKKKKKKEAKKPHQKMGKARRRSEKEER